MRSLKRPLLVLVTAFVLIASLAACTVDAKSDREKAVATREAVLSQAEKVAPVVTPVNFPIRKALVKYTVRQDQINTPWYVYVSSMTGSPIGYFVAQTYPINTCDFLSSSQIIAGDKDGNVVLDAPSLDGIFYGGSGSSAACGWFFFDQATDAMQSLSGFSWFASDQPLNLNGYNVITSAPKP